MRVKGEKKKCLNFGGMKNNYNMLEGHIMHSK